MKCKKCGKENIGWQKGITYKGLDEHHNPPQYMFKDEVWKGEIYNLCREFHTGKQGLHSTIILPHLLRNSNLLKKKNSEDWIWRYHILKDKIKIRNEIFKLTKDWAN